MKASIVKKEGINSTLLIEIPKEEINNASESRLRQVAKTAKIDGFRPGKIPLTMIKKKYGNQVRAEIINDLIPKKYIQALQDEKLNAVGIDIEIKRIILMIT